MFKKVHSKTNIQNILMLFKIYEEKTILILLIQEEEMKEIYN